jgi:prophage antirepressor-like protein
MDNVTIFNSTEFGDVRTLVIDKEPWFIGKDVAEILGYSNTRDALSKHVDEEDKNSVVIHDGTPGNPNQVIINESGVYSLIVRSKLDSAKRFRRWVTAEVLPSIRKFGFYSTADFINEALDNPDGMIEMLREIKRQREDNTLDTISRKMYNLLKV